MLGVDAERQLDVDFVFLDVAVAHFGRPICHLDSRDAMHGPTRFIHRALYGILPALGGFPHQFDHFCYSCQSKNLLWPACCGAPGGSVSEPLGFITESVGRSGPWRT